VELIQQTLANHCPCDLSSSRHDVLSRRLQTISCCRSTSLHSC
jgi:hypothetical protein